MKRLLTSLFLLAIAGFGCVTPESQETTDFTTYENTQYGFAFDYPTNVEVRVREEENRQTTYLGLDADFFVSVRDVVRDTKPLNLFFLYAVPEGTVDAFSAALAASNQNGAVQVKSVEDVAMGEIATKKITSTTEAGVDKIHYVFERNGALIVVSVFLEEVAPAEEIIRTFMFFP